MTLIEKVKHNKIVEQLFFELRKKYIKTNKLSGRLKFPIDTEEERYKIGEFFAIKYFNADKKEFSIPIKVIEELIYSFYGDKMTLVEFLVELFGEEIKTKSMVKEKNEKEKNEYFENLYSFSKNKDELKQFIQIEERLINTMYNSNKQQTFEDLIFLDKIISKLPLEEYSTLPFLANELFNDSHKLDIGTPLCNLFLRYIKHKHQSNISFDSIEGKNELFLLEKIKRDELSNHIMVFQVNRKNDVVIDTVCKEKEIFIMTLNKVTKNDTPFEFFNNQVFIVENNIVFQKLIDDLLLRNIEASVVCSSGQFNTAFYEFIKRIPEETTLYYSGDIDPEGLAMLNKIKQKFKNTHSFCMDASLYESSFKEKEISENRISMLNNLNHIDKNLLFIMEKEKKALYQEELYDHILNFISEQNIKKEPLI